jgi:sugar phosphate isomerase/epimerase
MGGRPAVSLQTKAVVAAVGVEAGLELAVEAGFESVVFWPGEELELLGSLGVASELGLDVVAVALPKAKLLEAEGRARVERAAGRVREVTTAPISLVGGDLLDGPPLEPAELAGWLATLPGPLVFENGGRGDERFADVRVVAAILDAAPGLRLALDLGHAAAAGVSPVDLPPAERVAYVEVHDNDGADDLHLPLGRGLGAGRSEIWIAALGYLPERVVVETDPRCGADREAWRRALGDDCAQVHEIIRQRLAVRA